MVETPLLQDDLPHAAPGAPGEPVAFVLPAALADLAARARPLAQDKPPAVPVAARLNLRLRDEDAIARVAEAFGTPLPGEPATFTHNGKATAIWQGPDEWLLISLEDDRDVLAERIQRAIGNAPSSLVDVTERSLTIAVSGEKAAELLNAGCPLDLAETAFGVGSGTRTVFGKSEVVLWRTGPDLYHLDVWRSFSPYVFGLLDEARRDFRV